MGFTAGLRIYAPLGIWVALAITAAVWLTAGNLAGVSPLIGLAGGALLLLCVAWRATSVTSTWNDTRRRTLVHWGQLIQSSIPNLGGTLPAQLEAELQGLEQDRGPQWITGLGYIGVSRALGQAEVSAMDHANAGQLYDSAELDKLKLTGSSVDNRDALLADLNDAITTLRSVDATQPPAGTDQVAAASKVKQARVALNDYRDSNRETLANLRRRTFDTVALAGLLAYLLTIVGTHFGAAEDARGQLASGVALFLVAAIVGMVVALNGLASMTKADDDFGLASARLLATAVLSGLAGVGGVLLVYLSGAAGALAPSGKGPTTLNGVFNVQMYPVTLVVTAVFGATPTLLITGLKNLGDTYVNNLTSTHPSSK